MDDDQSLGQSELNVFLEEWKKELVQESSSSSNRTDYSIDIQERLSYKRRTSINEFEPEEREFTAQPTNKRSKEDAAVIGGPALFVLPAVENTKSQEIKTVNDRLSSDIKQEELVDKLISDLNDINTLPFFDIQLPKEIAFLIFKYLTVKDLCMCSMVSSSWKLIAEDNVLWMSICKSMGYSTDIDGDVVWKNIVREIILHRKRTQQNWMERICEVSTYQPTYSGCLCYATYHNKEIILCYSNGDSHIWSLSTNDASTLTPSPATPTIAKPTCAAISDTLACIGDTEGTLRFYDLEKCQQIHHCDMATAVHVVAMATSSQKQTTVATATGSHTYPFSSLSVLETCDGYWQKSDVTLPGSAHFRNFLIQQISLLPRESLSVPFNLLYSTSSHLIIQSPQESFTSATILLAVAGNINCFSHNTNNNLLLCGIHQCGFHQVSLFDLVSTSHKETFKGHTGKIRCVSFDKDSNKFCMLSAGEDKKINIYSDTSCYPVIKLSGHSSTILTAQLEGWKVVSGSQDGTVAIWDLRMSQELWRTQDRHPVRLCEIENNYLIAGHIPTVTQYHSSDSSPLHTRQRGVLKIFDFSVDPLSHSNKLPSICSSSYDEPSASFYNLNLLLPYDSLP